jgi:hypothetical protein
VQSLAYVKDAKQAKAPNEGGQPTFDDGGAATAQSMELAQALPADAPASLDDVRAGRTLERGMRGKAVVELQKLLDIKATGVFDDATRAAVEAFQAEHQLSPVSGVVGPTTLKVIEQVARDGVSPKAQAQMNRLVAIAESGHQGAALGDCFRFVWLYITKAGYGKISKFNDCADMKSDYAKNFAEYFNVAENAKRWGIKRLSIASPYQAPKGAIVVVAPGTPGTRHPVAGDIAVARGNGTFINDGPNMRYGAPDRFFADGGRLLGAYVPAL